jgi:hypothetical protein
VEAALENSIRPVTIHRMDTENTKGRRLIDLYPLGEGHKTGTSQAIETECDRKSLELAEPPGDRLSR